jgi:hypothetical protein
MDKAVSSAMTTEYEPDLPWNQWIREPSEKDPGEERPKADRLRVVIRWPSIDESTRYSEGSSAAIRMSYARNCIQEIINPQIAGGDFRTGQNLLASNAKRNRKAWQLATNVGTHIFLECFLDEEEEKN